MEYLYLKYLLLIGKLHAKMVNFHGKHRRKHYAKLREIQQKGIEIINRGE